MKSMPGSRASSALSAVTNWCVSATTTSAPAARSARVATVAMLSGLTQRT
jgi:hypothetical protein